MNTEQEYLRARAAFADWFYIKTGFLCTTATGELMFARFLRGCAIVVKDNPPRVFAIAEKKEEAK